MQVLDRSQQRRASHPVVKYIPEAMKQLACEIFLDAVVGEDAAIFELLANNIQKLLIRRDTDLVLRLHLHVVYSVRSFSIEGSRFPVSVFTKICMPPRRRGTKLSVDSFRMS